MKISYGKNFRGQKGITIIAIVITTIILLILAGVTIAALTGDNGILKQAGNAKEQNEIAEEKEQIHLAYIAAEGSKLNDVITSSELENKMISNGNNVLVTSYAENFIVLFNDSNRYYEINANGDVSEPQEKIEDEFAGDITKGGKYTGENADKAYQISCIEDLVALSIATNGGKEELNIESSNYSGKYIKLTRTLDFNSYFSYNDATSTKYKDLNNDGIEENIYTEMTKTDENCVGLTPVGTLSATFDGQGNEIKNIYIKRSGSAALFNQVAKILNIGVTGNITSTGSSAAGICNGTSNKIENCWNKANITGYGGAAGIYSNANYVVGVSANNCYNTGEIIAQASYSFAGGISTGICGLIENCYNDGTVSAKYVAGGIASGHGNGRSTIKNCYNRGAIKSSACTGGILASIGDLVENCYNTGDVTANQYSGGIVGSGVNSILNCYNLGDVVRTIFWRDSSRGKYKSNKLL